LQLRCQQTDEAYALSYVRFEYLSPMHHFMCRMVERTMDFDINQRDRYGRTALMWAAELNHKETVETLIDLGSDRKLVEPQGGR